MKISDLIDEIDGQLVQDGEFEVLEYCTSSCEKKFLSFLENEKFLDKINPNVSCIITTEKLQNQIPAFIEGVVIAREPKKVFGFLHNFMSTKEEYAGKRFKTQIGQNCNISPLAYIASENVVIGDNVMIAPFVSVRENVYIGDGCKIYENSVIGGKGFNFIKTQEGQSIAMADCGKVVLEKNVEICSNCHIASGPLPTDVTKLEEEVKLDAMVHVGHGTRIGKRTLVPAGAQIAGNVDIGEDVWIGVNATISNRIVIEDGARVSLGSVVTKHVKKNETVTGNFAVPHDLFMEELKAKVRG